MGRHELQAVLGVLSLNRLDLIIVHLVKYVALRCAWTTTARAASGSDVAAWREAAQSPADRGGRLFGAAVDLRRRCITPPSRCLSALEGSRSGAQLGPYVLPFDGGRSGALFALQRKEPRASGAPSSGDGAVVAGDGVARLWDCQASVCMYALNPLVGLGFLLHSGANRLSRARWRVPVRDRRRGAVTRHGSFRRGAIKLAWSAIVFPSLILNYGGTGSHRRLGRAINGNIFYRLCPEALLLPLSPWLRSPPVTPAIDHHRRISMTRQAILLGWMPRLKVTQTSEQGYGRIYVAA